jgi:hypothetical protein
MLKIYYLVYKLRKNYLLWIIRRYENKKDALKDFEDYKKIDIKIYEKYMLIERVFENTEDNYNIIENELEYKQFELFNITNNDYLLDYIT